MAVKNSIQAIPLISFNTAGLTANYQLIGKLDSYCSILRITNLGDQPMLLSFDGVTDHEVIPAFDTFPTIVELQVQANAQPNSYAAAFSKNTPIYVKWQAGFVGMGILYISGYYQYQGA